MRDPHVVALHYTLETTPGHEFDNPPPLSVARPEFDARLDNGALVVTPREHYASAEAVRTIVEPFLRAWETDVLLHRLQKIRFAFERAEVVDRDPPAAGQPIEAHADIRLAEMTLSATATCYWRTYPSPPGAFAQTPIVDRMRVRFEEFREGRDSVFGTAYYCLTEIEQSVQGGKGRAARTLAAGRYGIDVDILNRIGELSSERGGPREARKAGKPAATLDERQWLHEALRAVIRRVARAEAGDVESVLTLADLPPLPAP